MQIFDQLNLWAIRVYAGQSIDFKWESPLRAKSIQALVADILKLVYQVGLPLIVLMFVYAGFLYVTARGDTGQVGKAKDAFKYTVIGAIIVLGASVISAVIQGTIKSLGQ